MSEPMHKPVGREALPVKSGRWPNWRQLLSQAGVLSIATVLLLSLAGAPAQASLEVTRTVQSIQALEVVQGATQPTSALQVTQSGVGKGVVILGKPCDWLRICGNLRLHKSSPYSVLGACDIDKNGKPYNRFTVKPGQSSKKHCKDLDAYYVPKGKVLKCLVVGRHHVGWYPETKKAGWRKVRDYWEETCKMVKIKKKKR